MNNLQQAPKDNLCPIESINHNYMTHFLHQAKYLLGMNKADQYSLVEHQTRSGQKWKWLKRRQVWVAYFKIWWKLGCTSRIEIRNTIARGGGAKNTITIDIWRRRRLRKWRWRIFWVIQQTCYWFVASNGKGVTITCLRLQEHTNENCQQDCKYSIFHENLRMLNKAHDIVDKTKLKLIELVSWY